MTGGWYPGRATVGEPDRPTVPEIGLNLRGARVTPVGELPVERVGGGRSCQQEPSSSPCFKRRPQNPSRDRLATPAGDVISAENCAGRRRSPGALLARNLSRVKLVTKDAHRGLVRDRRQPARRGVAAEPNALRGEPDGHQPPKSSLPCVKTMMQAVVPLEDPLRD